MKLELIPYDHPDGTTHYLSSKEADSVARLTPYVNIPWMDTPTYVDRESLLMTRDFMRGRPGAIKPGVRPAHGIDNTDGKPLTTLSIAIHASANTKRHATGRTICGKPFIPGATYCARTFGIMVANAPWRCCGTCVSLYFKRMNIVPQ